jgi:hypothetical protein
LSLIIDTRIEFQNTPPRFGQFGHQVFMGGLHCATIKSAGRIGYDRRATVNKIID